MARQSVQQTMLDTGDATRDCISDITYGEMLRERLLEESRQNGGAGDMKICVLRKTDEHKKIVRILFCESGGGVVSETSPAEFDTMNRWIKNQKEKVDGACVIRGDLCALVKNKRLNAKDAERDAHFLFLAVKDRQKPNRIAASLYG